MNTPANIYIAVVDDDERLCRSLSRLLHLEGFQPITFSSAEAFLADPVRPHVACLLVDIQLGGMSGLELHARLASQESRTPVIFITAHDDPAARAKAIEGGCAGYFRKTDPGAQIIEAIRGAVPAAATPSAP